MNIHPCLHGLYQADRYLFLPVTLTALEGEYYRVLCDLGCYLYTLEGYRSATWVHKDDPALTIENERTTP